MKMRLWLHVATMELHQGSGRPLGQSHSEAVMITKSIDKSTPLLHNAMNGELLSLVKLKCYRSSALGYPEHYYTILLRNARIVAMETSKGLRDSTPLEDVYFSYEEIIMEHETAHTLSQNKWGHSLALHKQRMQVLRNSANGYNTLMTSLEKRRQFFKEYPHYGDEKLKNFWMVSTLPLSASITGVGVMRAGWWAYRNPVETANLITGFGNTNYWNVTNRYQNIGNVTRRIFEELLR